MKRVKITWPQFIKDINFLAANLGSTNIINVWGITDIVGIARGGLFPAQLIAYKLGITRVHSFGVTYYKGEKKQIKPIIYQNLPVTLKGKCVLVVDEICDSGDTFRLVEQKLKNRGVKTLIFVTVYKKGCGKFDKIKVWAKVFAEDEWIILPTD